MEWARAPRPASPSRRPAVRPAVERPAPDPLLDLQRRAGNAAVSQLLHQRSETVQREALAESGPGAAARPVLKLGDSGPAVIEVQRALASLGYPVTLDGSYGARTAAFVCLMQLGLHLPVDGEVGPATWEEVDIFHSVDRAGAGDVDVAAAAAASSASPAEVGGPMASMRRVQRAKAGGPPEVVSVEDLPKAAPPTLQRGDSGTAVRNLQQALAALYSDAGVGVDGEFGSETAAFVLLFQVQNGLAADGVVGPATHQKLDPIASALRKVAAMRELGDFAKDISDLPPEERAKLKTLPSGISADIAELTSDE